MARNEEMERRLLNWARWRLTRGMGKLGYARTNLEEGTGDRSNPFPDAPVPTNDIEASETDDAVQRLPSDLRRTVEVCYVLGRSERERLAKLCISKTTMHQRIERAHRLLGEHFAARRERGQAERTRVEVLQRAGR